MPKYKEKPIGDFAQWKTAVQNKGYMSETVFYNIFQHYGTLHDKETALKYAIETAGKVEEAAGIEKKAGAYVVFEYEGKKITIPDLFMDAWVKEAKKEGIISLDLHDEHVAKFLEKYTDMDLYDIYKCAIAIDALVAKNAGIKVDPESPITYKSSLEVKKDTAVFFSEIYGEKEIPLHLYYKWLGSVLSKGKIDMKTNSEMLKYAKTGMEKERSTASFGFYAQFVKFMASYYNLTEKAAAEKAAKEYPEYFVNEMEGLLKGEVQKLAKLEVKLPKEEPGHIEKIQETGRVRVKLKGMEHSVGLDSDIYHLVYSGTVKNKGKAPSWARQKLFFYLVKTGGYYEDDAAKAADALIPFFEYQVAKDAKAAKGLLEKEKKLKVVPKK